MAVALGGIDLRSLLNKGKISTLFDIVDSSNPAPNTTRDNYVTTDVTAEAMKKATVAIDEQSAKISDTIKKIEGNMGKTNAAVLSIKSALSSAAEQSSIITSTNLIAEKKAQMATREGYQALGGKEAQVNLLAQWKQQADHTAQLLAKKEAIASTKITGISLIDGIVNDFRSMQVDEELNASALQEQHTALELQNIVTGTEGIAKTSALAMQSIDEGVIVATRKKMAAETNVALSREEIIALHSNSEELVRIANMSAAEVTNKLQEAKLYQDAAEYKDTVEFNKLRMDMYKREQANQLEMWPVQYTTAQVALSKARLELSDAKDPKARLLAEQVVASKTKDLASTIKARQEMVASIQKGQSYSGVTIQSEDVILNQLDSPVGSVREAMVKLQFIGDNNGQIGSSPADAVETIGVVAQGGSVKPTKILDFLQKIQQNLDALYANKTLEAPSPNDTVKKKADFNDQAILAAQTFLKNIIPGDTTNIYQAPPMDVLLTASNVVKNSSLYKSVLEKLGRKEANPITLSQDAVNGIIAGNIGPEKAAAGIQNIFATSVVWNNTSEGGGARVGLPLQTGYIVTVDRPEVQGRNFGVGFPNAKGRDFFTFGVPTTLRKSISNFAKPKTMDVDFANLAQVQEYLALIRASTNVPAPNSTEKK